MIKMARNIEHWPLSRLKPYAQNSNIHSEVQVQKLANAILKFGFTQPILADSAGEIIAGHGRLLAAQLLKMEVVPVIPTDHLSDSEKRAYLIVDNKLAELAERDGDILASELAALTLEDGFDFGEFGFSDSELASLLPDDELEAPPLAYEGLGGQPQAERSSREQSGSEATNESEEEQTERRRDRTTGEKIDPEAKLSKYITSSIRYMQLNFPEEEFEKLVKIMQALCSAIKLNSNAELVRFLVEEEAKRQGEKLGENADNNGEAA